MEPRSFVSKTANENGGKSRRKKEKIGSVRSKFIYYVLAAFTLFSPLPPFICIVRSALRTVNGVVGFVIICCCCWVVDEGLEEKNCSRRDAAFYKIYKTIILFFYISYRTTREIEIIIVSRRPNIFSHDIFPGQYNRHFRVFLTMNECHKQKWNQIFAKTSKENRPIDGLYNSLHHQRFTRRKSIFPG